MFLTGNGDSLCAAAIAAISCASCRDLIVQSVSSHELLRYWAIPDDQSLVVLISASGNSSDILVLAEALAEHSVCTLGITTNPKGRLLGLTEHSMILELPEKEPSPAFRSFYASLGALFVLLSTAHFSAPSPLLHLRNRIENLHAQFSRSLSQVYASIDEIMKHHLSDAVWIFVGSGPNQGTARYAAAKIIECLGQPALSTTIDEWCHVERHTFPDKVNMIIFAPIGHSSQKAIEIERMAIQLGWQVFIFSDENSEESAANVKCTFVVDNLGDECLSPFCLNLIGPLLAASLSKAANSKLFPVREFVEN